MRQLTDQDCYLLGAVLIIMVLTMIILGSLPVLRKPVAYLWAGWCKACSSVIEPLVEGTEFIGTILPIALIIAVAIVVVGALLLFLCAFALIVLVITCPVWIPAGIFFSYFWAKQYNQPRQATEQPTASAPADTE